MMNLAVALTLLTHDGGWSNSPLGTDLIAVAIIKGRWYDWLGVIGLLCFITRVALRDAVPFAPPIWRTVLDAGALGGIALVLAVVTSWATR